MKGKKARKIRKQVYGDLSLRNKEYTSSGDIYRDGAIFELENLLVDIASKGDGE